MTVNARRLHARHRTELTYAGHARESVNEVRLVPTPCDRIWVEHAEIPPEPEAEVNAHRDAFGNEVRWFQVVEAHERLVVDASALVVCRDPLPVGSTLSPGEKWSALSTPEYEDAMAEYLVPSTFVAWGEAVADLARDLHVPTGGLVSRWVHELSAAVHGLVSYEKGVTTADTPVETVAALRRGVCQDLAHLTIALCRRQGVAARYVSGWLYEPARSEPSESHAWIEAHVPGGGWVEVDPTHPEPVDSRYVRIGVGRDYADVAPVRGTYVGDATVGMTVTVDIEELAPVA